MALTLWLVQWLIYIKQDPDFGQTQTKNWISALQKDTTGTTRAIVVQSNDVILLSPNSSKKMHPYDRILKKTNDQSLTWQHDGQRLFFISNRERRALDIYRWNLASNKVERRSYNSRPKSELDFSSSDSQEKGILVSGAEVLEFSPKEGSMRQLLPPIQPDSKAFVFYQKLGGHFLKAKWLKKRNLIVAALQTEHTKQTLIIQNINQASNFIDLPKIIAEGVSVDFDVSSSNELIFTVQNQKFLEKNELPLVSELYLLRLNTDEKHLIHQTDKFMMIQPTVSPDGKLGTIILKRSQKGPDQLFILSSQTGVPIQMIKGNIKDVSWHPNSNVILYIKRTTKGNNAIYRYDLLSKREEQITLDDFDYEYPKFSPDCS